MALIIIAIVLIVLGSVIYATLNRREKFRASDGLPRLSGARLFFGTVAMLTMLFSGGCGLLFLINQDGLYVTWQAVLVLAGPPLAIGFLVWWLAMRRKPAA